VVPTHAITVAAELAAVQANPYMRSREVGSAKWIAQILQNESFIGKYKILVVFGNRQSS